MKKNIHPENYRLVVFKDLSCDYSFLTKSTTASKETIKWQDGKEYPLVKLDISDKSHPFFTGKMKLVDTAGRVEKFKNKYKKHLDIPTKPVSKISAADKSQAGKKVIPPEAGSKQLENTAANTVQPPVMNESTVEKPIPEDKNTAGE